MIQYKPNYNKLYLTNQNFIPVCCY